MYAKKVTALQWVDLHTFGDPRRNFKALYVFDDGFETEEACFAALSKLGYNKEYFATVFFYNQWYAVNITGYENFVVVSKENVIYKPVQFADEIEMLPVEGVTKGNKPMAYRLAADIKKWARGIEDDLRSIDPDAYVRYAGMYIGDSTILANNIFITFGREFFRTEICIRTDSYVERVFGNYYSSRSMEYARVKISDLRESGIEYYNPFTGETDKNDKAKERRTKAYLKKCKTVEDVSKCTDFAWQSRMYS